MKMNHQAGNKIMSAHLEVVPPSQLFGGRIGEKLATISPCSNVPFIT
jgi:hypothetical protein